MKLPYRTLAGALLGLLLIVLFYARMAQESGEIVEGQRKDKKAAEVKTNRAKLKADSVSASEATWRKSLVTALATRQRTTPLTSEELAAASRLKATRQKQLSDSIANAAKSVKSKQAADSVGALTGKQASSSSPKPSPKAPQPLPPSGWTNWLRRQLPWLLPLLAVLGALTLAVTGWLVWREWQKPLVESQREDLDPPVLRALLRAYASEIGECLPIPRQVKRFASKARLQNNLLLVAFKRYIATQKDLQPPLPVFTTTTQEILGFLLLLLLEEQTGHEDQAESQPVPNAPIPVRWRDLPDQVFIEQARTLFNAWHQKSSHAAMYANFTKLVAPLQLIGYEQLPASLATADGKQLLIELHRLNIGLLV